MIYKDLMVAFTRFGLLSYGGPSSLPLVHKEVVEVYGWMSSEEFADIVAIANALPGPILSKVIGYIGYKLAGILGLLVALVSLTLPTSVLMVIIMTTFRQFGDYPWVQGMTRAVVPVIGVMLAVLAWQFLYLAAKELRWPIVTVHVVAVAVAIVFVGIHPAIVIALMLLWAMFGKVSKNDGV